jgi:hypothetical protein
MGFGISGLIETATDPGPHRVNLGSLEGTEPVVFLLTDARQTMIYSASYFIRVLE